MWGAHRHRRRFDSSAAHQSSLSSQAKAGVTLSSFGSASLRVSSGEIEKPRVIVINADARCHDRDLHDGIVSLSAWSRCCSSPCNFASDSLPVFDYTISSTSDVVVSVALVAALLVALEDAA